MTIKRLFPLSIATTGAAVVVFAVLSACSNEPAKAKPNVVTKDAPRAGVVARIGGEEITEEALIGDDKLDFFDLKKREYDLKMERLNKLMVDKLIGAEAKKAGMGLDDFIKKKITGGEIKITDKEFKKFVADKHIPESQLNPQIKERINNYLQTMKRQDMVQAYIAKITKSAPVDLFLETKNVSGC